MTKEQKEFIEKYVHMPWSVQQLFLVEHEDWSFGDLKSLPFTSIEQILNFAEIPFFKSMNDELALAYLPQNSPFILDQINELLIEASGYYIACLNIPSFDLKKLGPIAPDLILQSSLTTFRNTVMRVSSYINSQIKPVFSQQLLDSLLDELTEKSFRELSPLKQKQLQYLSEYLSRNYNSK